MFFQTCMTYFFQWDAKDDILRNEILFFFPYNEWQRGPEVTLDTIGFHVDGQKPV